MDRWTDNHKNNILPPLAEDNCNRNLIHIQQPLPNLMIKDAIVSYSGKWFLPTVIILTLKCHTCISKLFPRQFPLRAQAEKFLEPAPFLIVLLRILLSSEVFLPHESPD